MENKVQTRRQFVTKAAALAGGAMLSDMAIAQTRMQGAFLDSLWKGDEHMKSADAPISIKSTTLVVNNLENVGRFYQSTLGFNVLRSDGEVWELGVGDDTLLILQKDVHARRYPNEAGLFHNAFVMPNRSALGSWFYHAGNSGVRFTGMANHEVSEAIYLDDPEGNGIEVYFDTPSENWVFQTDGQLRMNTVGLDVQSVLDAAQQAWNGAPDQMVIGHVHLQVGDVDSLHQFMTESLGQDLMVHEGSVAFYSTGGYHHHFAGNIWNSRNAGIRSPDATGLAGITLRTDGTLLQPGKVMDPWSNHFTIEEA